MVPPSILDVSESGASCTPPRYLAEDDFVAWVQSQAASAEWLNGEVIPMSPASFRHIEITHWLIEILNPYIRKRKLGKLAGPDFMVRLQHGGTSRRVPDLLFVSQANLIRLKPNHLEGPPDLAIEIVSPDSVDRDWHEKPSEYERAGVQEYWVIDPLTDTFQASVRNAEGRFIKQDPDAHGAVHSTTVPGFWIKPEWYWQLELPDPSDVLRELSL